MRYQTEKKIIHKLHSGKINTRRREKKSKSNAFVHLLFNLFLVLVFHPPWLEDSFVTRRRGVFSLVRFLLPPGVLGAISEKKVLQATEWKRNKITTAINKDLAKKISHCVCLWVIKGRFDSFVMGCSWDSQGRVSIAHMQRALTQEQFHLSTPFAVVTVDGVKVEPRKENLAACFYK